MDKVYSSFENRFPLPFLESGTAQTSRNKNGGIVMHTLASLAILIGLLMCGSGCFAEVLVTVLEDASKKIRLAVWLTLGIVFLFAAYQFGENHEEIMKTIVSSISSF